MRLKISQGLKRLGENLVTYTRLIRETAWVATGQIGSVFASFFLIRFFTDNLTIAEYGELALALTLAMMINQVISGGISAGINRFYSIAVEQDEKDLYVAGSLQILAKASMACLAIFVVLMCILVAFNLNEWLWITICMMCFSITSGLNSAFQAIQSAARNRVTVAIHQTSEIAIRILFGFLLFQIYNASTLLSVVAYMLSGFLILVSQLYFIQKLLPFSLIKASNVKNNGYSSKVWSQAWPMTVWGIFTAVQLGSDRWALGYFASIADVGAYAVIYQLGFAPMILLAGIAVGLISPILFQKAGTAETQQRVEEIYRLTKIITLIAMPGVLIVAGCGHFFRDLIFSIAVNERFHEYSYLFPLMILAAGFHGCHQVIGIRFSASLNVRKLLFPQIFSALLFVICNIIGAYMAGVNGLVYAFLGASLFYFLWILVLSELTRGRYANDAL